MRSLYEFLSDSSHAASAYLTVSVGYDRYLAICHPLAERGRLSKSGGMVALSLTAACAHSAVLVSVPRLLGLDLAVVSDKEFSHPALVTYIVLWAANAVADYIAPFLVTGVLSCLVLRRLSEARRRWGGSGPGSGSGVHSANQRAATRVLMTVVAVFLACHAPYVLTEALGFWWFFTRSESEMEEVREIYWTLEEVSSATMVINCSANFVIYALRDRRFRAAVAGCCCCWKKNEGS